MPDPKLFGFNFGPAASYRGLDGNLPSPVFGWVALAATVAPLACSSISVRRGTLGRRMLAVRSNERAAAGAAIDVRNVKLIAFGISALIAGVAGTLYAYNFGSVSADRFSVPLALSLIAFAYAGGITLVSGAVFAGLIAAQGHHAVSLDKWFGLSGNWFLLFGGVVLIFTLIQNPEGVAGSFYRTAEARAAQASEGSVDMSAVLATTGLSVRFGGVHAVEDVDLDVEEGQLVGLIGPNGAGKTTFVDAITGFVRYTGAVELDGRDLDGAAPARPRPARSRPDLAEHRAVRRSHGAREPRSRSGAALVPCPRGRSRRATDPAATEAADEALELLDLGGIADAMPTELTQGQRKLVGVARAIAMQPRLLCLDEPAAGLDTRESEDLGQRLRQIADAGTTTLLIDHDMGLVLNICDRIVVLEFGQVIAAGPPDEVRRDARVVEAYLGGGSRERGRGDCRRSRRRGGRADVSAPVLEIDALTAGYDSAAVIRDISLEVAPGEVVALLGANGAGKTTTLRAVSGLVHPMSGAIRVEGQDLRRVSASARARLGIAHVPESRGLFFGLTVAEHLRLGYRREQLDAEAAYRYFPALAAPAETGAAACSPAVSSRCWPSGGLSPGIPGSCSSTSSASAWRR